MQKEIEDVRKKWIQKGSLAAAELRLAIKAKANAAKATEAAIQRRKQAELKYATQTKISDAAKNLIHAFEILQKLVASCP